ncbi:hypothetical protein FQZ97_592600 [compost metagenome]
MSPQVKDTLWRLARYLGGQWLVQLAVVALASAVGAYEYRHNEFGGLAWVVGAWAVMVTGLVSAPLWIWTFFRSKHPWRWGLAVSVMAMLGMWLLLATP